MGHCYGTLLWDIVVILYELLGNIILKIYFIYITHMTHPLRDADLSLIKTSEAITRTYLSQIRTSGIFCGISVILIKKIPKFYVNLLLSSIIILNIIFSVNYYIILTKYSKSKEKNIFMRDFYFNILFSIVLIIILLMIIYINRHGSLRIH